MNNLKIKTIFIAEIYGQTNFIISFINIIYIKV